MTDRKVKGTVLVDQVRMIKGNRDKEWDKYLKPEDWDIIESRILPSMWYPLEVFQRLGMAVFHLVAGGNLELVRAWGRFRMDQLAKDVYKILVSEPNPAKALDRFAVMSKQLFNFTEVYFENADEKHAKISISYDPNDPATEVYCSQLMGHFDRLIELTGGNNVKVELIEKEWEGASATIFDITWE